MTNQVIDNVSKGVNVHPAYPLKLTKSLCLT